jgi:hypothetical protein
MSSQNVNPDLPEPLASSTKGGNDDGNVSKGQSVAKR